MVQIEYVISVNRQTINSKYVVIGGYLTSPFETNDITIAYDEYFRRIKFTKPKTNSTIMLLKISYNYETEEGSEELIHRVTLN